MILISKNIIYFNIISKNLKFYITKIIIYIIDWTLGETYWAAHSK